MRTFIADIRLIIETDDENDYECEGWENELHRYLGAFAEEQASFIEPEGAEVIIDQLKVEESNHDFRVLVNGEWCEPSDDFAKTVEEIEKNLSRPATKVEKLPRDPEKEDKVREAIDEMRKDYPDWHKPLPVKPD